MKSIRRARKTPLQPDTQQRTALGQARQGRASLYVRSTPKTDRKFNACGLSERPKAAILVGEAEQRRAAPEDALWMDAPDFAVAQAGLRIQSSI
jgi:hypothetical protein